MAGRELIWSHRASKKLFDILDYFKERNGSSIYSKKLYKKIIREISLVRKQPEIGVKTDMTGIRGIIIENYILFYEASETTIIIHTIWDSRQNPDNLTIK